MSAPLTARNMFRRLSLSTVGHAIRPLRGSPATPTAVAISEYPAQLFFYSRTEFPQNPCPCAENAEQLDSCSARQPHDHHRLCTKPPAQIEHSYTHYQAQGANPKRIHELTWRLVIQPVAKNGLSVALLNVTITKRIAKKSRPEMDLELDESGREPARRDVGNARVFKSRGDLVRVRGVIVPVSDETKLHLVDRKGRRRNDLFHELCRF